MSHPVHAAPPPPNLSHRVAAAGVSAAVAVLFLLLALPLGRPSGAVTSADERPPAVAPVRAVAKAISGEVEHLTAAAEQDPERVLQALDPLFRSLLQRSPEAARQALDRWVAAAQTAAR
jgi:hypothetical protein